MKREKINIAVVLAVFVAIALLFCGSGTIVRAGSERDMPRQLFGMINDSRDDEGLPAYKYDETLSRVAELKCRDMVENGYFSHESPKYGNVTDMLKTFDISAYAAENIAEYSTLEKAHAALMTSPAHRRNIMARGFDRVGISVIRASDGSVTVVEIFAKYK